MPSSDSTTSLNNPDEFRPFNQWFNEHRLDELNPYKYEFSFFDLDGILFTIRANNNLYFQMLEVKTYGKSVLRPSQKVGLIALDRILSKCVPTTKNGNTLEIDGFDFKGRPQKYKVWYLGLHILSLSDTRPDKSEVIKWDGQQIGLDQLYKKLRMKNE